MMGRRVVVQAEAEYQQLNEIEKEAAVLLTVSQEIRQLIEALRRIQLHNKRRSQIHGWKRGRIAR